MADSFFATVAKVIESSSMGDAKQFGVDVAIVTNNDPSSDNNAPPWAKAGNAVKVKFVRLPNGPESDWARVVQPAAGAGRGFYWLPHVNDEVLIAWERGEAHRPYVIGSLWNGKDKPMKNAFSKENTTIMLQTKSGHQVILDDKKDAEK